MKEGGLKFLLISVLVSFNLSLFLYDHQSEKPVPTILLEKGTISHQTADFRLGHVDLQNLVKKKPETIQGRLLFSHNQAFEAKSFKLKQITQLDSPFVYAPEKTKLGGPGKFSIELYRVTEAPNTHIHIREVDHNNIGYGGGLKIALEIVEDF